MALQLEKIFLGNTPSEQRKYIVSLFGFLKDKYPKLVVPACGQFSLVKCAIEAGYLRENIITSDVSLFSTVLGYLYSGKPLSDINFTVPEQYRADYEPLETDCERAAFLIWVMKLYQLREDVYYEQQFRLSLIDTREFQITKLAQTLKKMTEYYKGIDYDIRDLREVIEDEAYGDDTIMVINPPAFRDGYSKMFAFEEVLDFKTDIEEFDLKKEYRTLYDHTKTKPYLTVWYRFKEVIGFDSKEVIFAKEYSVDRFDYWLITKPEVLKGFKYANNISFNSSKHLRPYRNAPIWTDTDVLTKDTKVRFAAVEDVVALYYRDLWAHKLGNTGAEHYFLILLDGKVFATVGFHTSELFRLKSDKVFENYGFNAPSKAYPKLNRLMMYLITCKEMGTLLRATASKVNRIYKLNGMKTTCLSKYRKVKLNNGLMSITKKEKMPDGVYKLMYECEWHDRTFADGIALFLAEQLDSDNLEDNQENI